MGAYEVANGLESAAVARLKAIYESALRTALRRQHAFLAQIKAIDEGKIKPPQWYIDRGLEKEWREGFTKELLRKNKVIEGIMEDFNAVGGDAAEILREFTCDVYDVTRKETIEILSHEAAKMGVNPSFATYNKKQIGVLIQKEQSPFSKLAFANLGKNPAVRRRLQNEMAQAAILGESQQKLVKRIQAVTGQLTWQAKRVAQTERTRVQSQATYEAGMEAKKMGIKVYYIWNTRMVNSRDTHIALNGKKAMFGDRFPGSILRFPGDPNAPLKETINCHCAVEEHVLLPDEELGEDGEIVENTILKTQNEHGIMNWETADFENEEIRTSHFEKHKDSYPGFSESDYINSARSLLSAELVYSIVEEFVRSDGSISRYDFKNNDFVAITQAGVIKTFFKPKAKEAYWQLEHDRNK